MPFFSSLSLLVYFWNDFDGPALPFISKSFEKKKHSYATLTSNTLNYYNRYDKLYIPFENIQEIIV